MLSKDAIELYCRRLNLTDKAIRLIRKIRSSPPSRRVSGGGCSVCARYPSKKMGITIQAESSHCELVYIHTCEHDDDVLEYYDQPSRIKLEYPDRNGRNLGVWHTPDFFVLQKTGAGYIECKEESSLLKLAEKSPHRFVFDEAGYWRCPPGEEYAEQFGLFYRVWTPSNVNPILYRNIEFLSDYLTDEKAMINDDARYEILEIIESNKAIRLIDLLETLTVATSDNVFSLIARDEIYVNLEEEVLAEPNYIRVFRSNSIATAYKLIFRPCAFKAPGIGSSCIPESGDRIHWKRSVFTILNIDDTSIAIAKDGKEPFNLSLNAFLGLVDRGEITGSNPINGKYNKQEAHEIFFSANNSDIEEAISRHEIIKPILEGKQVETHIPKRTIRYWVSKSRMSKQIYGDELTGLITPKKRKGNRRMKLSEETYDAMVAFIKSKYGSKKQPKKYHVYAMFVDHCKKSGIASTSYKTFAITINKLYGPELTKARQGSRAAYQESDFFRSQGETLPRHGDRPFEIAHIDHTQADLELIDSEDRCNLGRPWITKLTDAWSRKILAIFVSYERPSYVSCMMALRICVLRHRRLPETIISDRGKEFESTAYETFLARYGVTKKSRPPAKPRHGSIDERGYGTINTQLIYNLDGNTQITKFLRYLTKTVNPKRLAKLTLESFYDLLCEYCYEIYDQKTHQGLGVSPREKFQIGMLKSGERPQRLIAYDMEFQILSLPTTPKGTVKISRQRGVTVNYIQYFSPVFKFPENAGKNVPVRYDPLNMGVVYVYVNGRWERCLSDDYSLYRDRTQKEIIALAAEIRKKNKNASRRYLKEEALKHGAFLNDSIEANELLKKRKRIDAETRNVYSKILNMGGDHIGQNAIEEPLKEESIGTSPNCDNKPAAPSEDQSLLDKYDDLDLLNDYE